MREKKWCGSWKLTQTLNNTFSVSKTFHGDSLGNIGHMQCPDQPLQNGACSSKTVAVLTDAERQISPRTVSTSDTDFHVFGKLKQHLSGREFPNDGQAQIAVLSWFQVQRAIFYRQVIKRLVQLCDKCLQLIGDYVKK